jgi:hypothetical protein
MTITIIAAYILLIWVFIVTFRSCTAASDLQRRKLLKWNVVLIIAWGVVIYYLQHNNKYSSSWVDACMEYFVAFGWAWPSIIAQAFNSHRYGSAIIQLKPTIFNIAIAIICIIVMILIVFVYAPSYYENMSWWRLISFIMCYIPVALALPIMYVQKTAFYTGGIFYCGLLWAWSDFESYSWKGDKLLLQRKKSRPLRIAIPPADRQIVDNLLAMHIITSIGTYENK